MNPRFLLLLISFVSLFSYADVGIGVSFKDNQGAIYVPVNINENFRIEPSLYYQKSQDERDDGTESDYLYLTVSTSFYKISKLTDQSHLYYGAGIGYIENHRDYRTGGTYPRNDRVRASGYQIAPTLGAEYKLTEDFSISAQVALIYQHIETDDLDKISGEKLKETDKDLLTNTNIVLRFFF